MIGWEALIHRTYRHERMTRDKEDDDLGKTLSQPLVSMLPMIRKDFSRITCFNCN